MSNDHENLRSSLESKPISRLCSFCNNQLHVNEQRFTDTHAYSSYRNKQCESSYQHQSRHSYSDYQIQRHLSSRKSSATMNICNLCHRHPLSRSSTTIHSNLEMNNTAAKSSLSSLTSVPSRRQYRRNSAFSNILSRSNSYFNRGISSKIKQSAVWNQQEKAFRQLFAIVFGFTCCFLPYFILYMVVAFCGSCVSERLLTGSVWLGYVNSTINPFLYALSNEHFRRTSNRILKRDRRRQSYYN